MTKGRAALPFEFDATDDLQQVHPLRSLIEEPVDQNRF
jgi:hypothetical protein